MLGVVGGLRARLGGRHRDPAHRPRGRAAARGRRAPTATTRRLDRIADVVIVVAYVISVALYLRIMAQYIVDYAVAAAPTSPSACSPRAAVAADRRRRRDPGLPRPRPARAHLAGRGAGADHRARRRPVPRRRRRPARLGGGSSLPPVPDKGLVEVLLVLGGIVITVQGFETVRYLGDEYDAETRIWASRVAQLVADLDLHRLRRGGHAADGARHRRRAPTTTLLDITDRVLPLLSLPLVISPCSASSAPRPPTPSPPTATCGLRAPDADGPRLPAQRDRRDHPRLDGRHAAIIAIASRAFAAYYAIQALIASDTTESLLAGSATGCSPWCWPRSPCSPSRRADRTGLPAAQLSLPSLPLPVPDLSGRGVGCGRLQRFGGSSSASLSSLRSDSSAFALFVCLRELFCRPDVSGEAQQLRGSLSLSPRVVEMNWSSAASSAATSSASSPAWMSSM